MCENMGDQISVIIRVWITLWSLNYGVSYITNGGGLSFNFGCVH